MKILKCGNKEFDLSKRPIILGVLNITPDSFSDGGKYLNLDKAIKHALNLINQGADIIDIGGESTAPNRNSINLEEELSRVLPVIKGLSKLGINNISIDTSKAKVAEEALNFGASWINDQSACAKDKNMAIIMSQADGVIIMHNNNNSLSGVDAGEFYKYNNIISEIKNFFENKIRELNNFNILNNKIIIDPGIGFGKGLRDTMNIINNLNEINNIGAGLMIGLSRKSFLGVLTDIKEPIKRDFATVAAEALAVMNGANIIRTHNVLACVQMLKVINYEPENYENIY